MEHVGEGDTNCNWCAQNDPQRLGKGGLKIWKSEKEQRSSKLITEISKNIEKSPRELKRLPVTQTPGEEQIDSCPSSLM